MNIGIMKDGICINAAVFEDMDTARQFLALGLWPGADGVAELPDGCGIGDVYSGGEWTRIAVPAPETPGGETSQG